MEELGDYFEFMKSNWKQLAQKNPNVKVPELQDIILTTWKKAQISSRGSKDNLQSEKDNKVKGKNVASYDGNGLDNPYLVKMFASNDSDKNDIKESSESEEDLTAEQKEVIHEMLPPAYKKSRKPKTSFVPPIKKKFPLCAALMNNNSNKSFPSGGYATKQVVSVQDESVKKDLSKNTQKDREDNKESNNFIDDTHVVYDGDKEAEVYEASKVQTKEVVSDEDKEVEKNEESKVQNRDVVSDDDKEAEEHKVSKVQNKDPSMYGCEKCKKNFKQLKSLEVHKCAIQSKVPCPSCSKLISKTNLSHHVKTHFSGKKLKCKKCKLSFNSADAKKQHMISKLHNSHTCNVCRRAFTRPSLLREHLTIHVGEDDSESPDVAVDSNQSKSYYCKFCKENFLSVVRLQNHMSTEHSDQGDDCSQCGKTFFSKRGMDRHIETHEKVNIKLGQLIEHPSQEAMFEVVVDQGQEGHGHEEVVVDLVSIPVIDII